MKLIPALLFIKFITFLARFGGCTPKKNCYSTHCRIFLVTHETNFCIAFYKTILAPIGRGRRRLPLGRPRAVRRASPGKRVQIASMQFGPVSFLQKLTCHSAKTYRALHGAICFTKGANCLEAGRLPGSGRRGLTIQCAPD